MKEEHKLHTVKLSTCSLQALDAPRSRKRPRSQSPIVPSKSRKLLKSTLVAGVNTDISVPQINALGEDTRQAEDYKSLLFSLRNKYRSAHWRQQKLPILALCLQSWTIAQVCQYFNCGKKLVRTARCLRKSKRLLENPSPRTNRPLNASVKTSITNFYQGDRISCCLPGKKDVLGGTQNGCFC